MVTVTLECSFSYCEFHALLCHISDLLMKIIHFLPHYLFTAGKASKFVSVWHDTSITMQKV